MPLTANKQRQASGTSDFDQLLNIIEEDEKPRKKSSKGASSRSSAKGSELEVEEAPGKRKGKGKRGKTKRAGKESKRTKGRTGRSRF